MKRLLLLAVALAGAAGAKPAAAPRTLDPAKAYAIVEVLDYDGGKVAGSKIKAPGSVTLARYDAAAQDVRGGVRSPATALAKDEPVRVTTAGKPLVKEKGWRLYLLTLAPDTWVVEGAQGTAFSLGSVAARLEPGRLYDLGVFAPAADWRPGETQGISTGGLMGMALLGPFAKAKDPTPAMAAWHVRGAGDMALPAEVRALAPEAPAYEVAPRFGNYLGGLVNRIGGRATRATEAAEAAPPGS